MIARWVLVISKLIESPVKPVVVDKFKNEAAEIFESGARITFSGQDKLRACPQTCRPAKRLPPPPRARSQDCSASAQQALRGGPCVPQVPTPDRHDQIQVALRRKYGPSQPFPIARGKEDFSGLLPSKAKTVGPKVCFLSEKLQCPPPFRNKILILWFVYRRYDAL